MTLVVAFCAFSLDVLLNSINLALIANQAFFNFIQLVVDFVLENLILPGVVSNSMIGCLLAELGLILAHQALDQVKTVLFFFESCSKLVNLSKFVSHLVLHLVNTIRDSLHLLINAIFKGPDLFEIGSASFNFNLKLGCSHFGIVQLSLLKIQIFTHFINLVVGRQAVLSCHVFLHVLEKGKDYFLIVLDIGLVLSFFLFKLYGKLVDLFLFLIQDFVLLRVFILGSLATALNFVLNLFDVLLISLNHFSHI